MEKEKRTRGAIRKAFNKLYEAIDKKLSGEDEDPNEVDIKSRATLLERKASELMQSDKKILEFMVEDPKSDDAALEKETAEADEYQLKYVKLQLGISNFLLSVGNAAASVNGESNSCVSRRKFKLPEIELIKYGGEVKEWLHFWSQFSKIDGDNELAEEDKFQYLIQATKEGSRARELVTSFPPTGQNYKKAIDGLKTRFGRDDLQVEVYVRELLSLLLRKVLNKNEKISLCALYDKLESQLRALETLGVTSEKNAAMLFPLVESCMPEELLRTWKRMAAMASRDGLVEVGGAESLTTSNRLNKLMSFLRNEVENEEKISLATSGFDVSNEQKVKSRKILPNGGQEVPTATSLVSIREGKSMDNCVFCAKNHASADCFKARGMSMEAKGKIIREKRCCFYCLRKNHIAKHCKVYVKCHICEGRHVVIMCPKLNANLKVNEPRKEETPGVHVLMGCSSTQKVFLQTLMINVKYRNGIKRARALIDSGSQKSYILEEFADSIDLVCKGKEHLKHTLFGGIQTKMQEHKIFDIQVNSLDQKYSCIFKVLSQPTIVQGVSALQNKEWISDLKGERIVLTDVGEMEGTIHVLIGADIAGKLYTGNRYHLKCGLVAMETHLGWTVMGKAGVNEDHSYEALNVMSMLVHDKKINELWDLEAIGIKDPAEFKSKQEREQDVKEFFLNTIKRNEEGRYEIKLPWVESKQELSTNYEIAERRLFSLTRKLKVERNYADYEKVFKEWSDEGIIEELPNDDIRAGHFMPHRHVIKEGSTTRIRPVFDASARGKYTPSLNDCLETGPNMIELINTVLLRFRLNRIGVTSDIRRAFLQISVNKEDRGYLKFLWWNEKNQIKIYRHARVVFGVSSSMYLLAAVIDYHLNETLKQLMDDSNEMPVSKDTVSRLMSSFYVDNCVTSVGNENELKNFIRESRIVMSSALFDLRGWEYTNDNASKDDETTIVLGLKWNKQLDVIELNLEFLKAIDVSCVTKRLVLSVAHKVFDTIGVSCPVMLFPKLLLQEMWNDRVHWDVEVDKSTRVKFLKWFNELHKLSCIKLPRWVSIGNAERKNYSIHTFCDASETAYAAAIFVRVEMTDGIEVHLVQGKARIAPLKKLTPPKLELMAATVGARLTSEIVRILKDIPPISVNYWTDSTTVLTWIKRNGKRNVFVRNRVKEIHQLTKPGEWYHIPGENNPADLPSRGCSVKRLLEEKWWEGPNWLKQSPNEWPKSDVEVEEDEIKSMIAKSNPEGTNWLHRYFSSFNSIRRLLAWIVRFVNNCDKKVSRSTGELSIEEINDAEKRLMKMIQQEWFEDSNHLKNISTIQTIYDTDGIMRVCTKIILRDEDEKFRYPIILPDQHPLVKLLIKERHEALNHAGVQMLLNSLRESFWIIKGRRAIRSVIQKCVKCNRFAAKSVEALPGILPLDRIRDAKVFEIVGVDFAGPLHIKGNDKVWICLFTCGVYRAVHMEVVSQLSTSAFMQSLRRFIARRGRPAKIYSDNGTNFVGAENLLKSLNWREIEKFAVIQKIKWYFNPPTASWWGGWWERIIRIVKDLLKRVLGRACVSYEELLTIVCDCESIVNNRPITYMMDGDPTVAPLTPNMFLQEVTESGVMDLDQIDEESLNNRIKYLQKLRSDLRRRFRKEYLGSLIQKSKLKLNGSGLKVGEIVLVGNDVQKRLDWPLARIIELIPGKDGEVRLAKLKTSRGELLRPVQRIHRLEVYSDVEDDESKSNGERGCDQGKQSVDESQIDLDEKGSKAMKTRTRIVRRPKRYED